MVYKPLRDIKQDYREYVEHSKKWKVRPLSYLEWLSVNEGKE